MGAKENLIMNEQEIKQWQALLKEKGYYKGAIDGIFGGGSKRGLQQFLKDEGYYQGNIDGIFGEKSNAALASYNEDHQHWYSGIVNGISEGWNSLWEPKDESVEVPKGPNLKEVYEEEPKSLWDSFKDWVSGDSEPEEIPAVRRDGDTYYFNDTTPFDRSNLRNATLRYAFDNYYNDDNRKDQYGFYRSYRQLLWINDDYTPEEAQAIAAGAGEKQFMYDGKVHKTNLFIGSPYKDEEDFKNTLNQWVKDGTITPEAAQYMISKEYDRQLNTYGIVNDMLYNKGDSQYNEYFGVVPYGYNPEGMWSIVKGKPAVKTFDIAEDQLNSNMFVLNPTYRDEEGQEGRFKYDNFDQWYKGRVLADKKYTSGNGLSNTRAVTSSYSLGFPIDSSMINKTIRIAGGRPDYNEDGSFKGLDFSSYHTLTDANRGSMNPKVGLELLSKDPVKVKAYLDHLVDGDRKAEDYFTKADELVAAAGLSKHGPDANHKNYFHRYNFQDNGTYFDPDDLLAEGADLKWKALAGEVPAGHDMLSSLKSFRDNAFDENGNWNQSFKYGENGYEKNDAGQNYDGGNYTVYMQYNPKTGKWDWNAWDDWNIDLDDHDFGMNTNNGHGIRLRSDSNGTTFQGLYNSNTDVATRTKNEQLLKQKRAQTNGQYTLKRGGKLLKYINNKCLI